VYPEKSRFCPGSGYCYINLQWTTSRLPDMDAWSASWRFSLAARRLLLDAEAL